MTDRTKLYHRIFKIVFFILFITYVTLYFSQATGYYEFEQHKKVTLTEEQIKKFEQDVAAGKNIDLEQYLESPTKNYQNKASRLGLTISEQISKYVKKGIDETFKLLNSFMQE